MSFLGGLVYCSLKYLVSLFKVSRKYLYALYTLWLLHKNPSDKVFITGIFTTEFLNGGKSHEIINIGVLAHVDAGKTTLTESVYNSGAITNWSVDRYNEDG